MTFGSEALTPETTDERIEVPSSPTPRVSVIITAAAGSKFLAACLRSLARHAPAEIPFETIVVLNNAEPSHTSELMVRYSGITVMTARANLGLPGAANYA